MAENGIDYTAYAKNLHHILYAAQYIAQSHLRTLHLFIGKFQSRSDRKSKAWPSPRSEAIQVLVLSW